MCFLTMTLLKTAVPRHTVDGLLSGDDDSRHVHSPTKVDPHRRSVDVAAIQLDAVGHVVTGSDVTRRRGRGPGVVVDVTFRLRRASETVHRSRLLVGDILHCAQF